MAGKFIDEIGNTYGRLTVIGRAPNKNYRASWICRCQCGNEITVIGKDMVGILAKVSAICADKGANVLEVTQSIMQDMFAMIMMIDISKCNVSFSVLTDEFEALGSALGLKIHVMHEDVFNSMHRI